MWITVSFYYAFVFQSAIIIPQGLNYLRFVTQNRKIVNVIANPNHRLWKLFDFTWDLVALVKRYLLFTHFINPIASLS